MIKEMQRKAVQSLALLSAVLMLALFAPKQAVAQDQSDDDPPSRVARLSYTNGAVSMQPAGTDDWVDATINRPMTTGDKLWSDQGARAELRIDSTAIRLGDQTGFSFINLDDKTTQIRLTEGTLNLRVRRLDDDQIFEVDTPNLAFTVLRPGTYKINVNENGDATIITVHGGDGEVTGGGSAYPVHADQEVSFTGTDQLSADVQNIGGGDDFDRFCADRDNRWDRSTSDKYVSDDVVGYEDLDDYGGWRPVPEYGTVWFPHTTVVGWAPYRYGHWVWISPWGWTWIDDSPWGYAPFHYGRWVTVGGVWGWVPSPPRPRVVTVAYVRPVWAPALVAWVGGPRWGVNVGIGGGPGAGVAWFPLGPRDVYCPSYRVSPRYVERVNISNTTIINRTYVTNVYNNVYVNKTVNVTNIKYQNQTVNNSVTATNRAAFTGAQPVGRNMIRVDQREIASAPVAPLTPGVAPEQRSVIGGGAQARVRPAQTAFARPVVAKTAPPPAPVNFARQQQAIQQNGGRPIGVQQERQLQTQTTRPNIRVAPPATRQIAPVYRGPQQNVSQPGQPNNRPAVNPPQPNVQQPPNGQQPNNGRPAVNTPNNPQQPGNPNPRDYRDRPPTSRPTINPQLEQKQQDQSDKLRQQQDRERQKMDQRQAQEQQKIQQRNADDARQQQIQQRQQQQMEQMERKHQEQQQKLQQKQQQEVQKQQARQPRQQKEQPKQQPAPKPPKNNDRPR